MQLEHLSSVLDGYGLDTTQRPAASIILLMAAISRFLLMEEAFDVDVGHAETIALIERQIEALEGARERDTTFRQRDATSRS
jgi:hypothetical protein